MRRVVEPELLDDLRPSDPEAAGSRADLRRLNIIMGHAGILSRAARRQAGLHLQTLRLVELGAGDGTLLLRVARGWRARGTTAHVTIVDRQNLVSAETRRAFDALNWTVESVSADVFAWLEQEQSSPAVDVMLANLFLHHFPDERLRALLRLAAMRTKLFIACEPRRSQLPLLAARCLWLIGCNRVTRHDAVVSVRAGFVGDELSGLWPSATGWQLSDKSAGMFSHCFTAQRNA
jgi:hypothetical protein